MLKIKISQHIPMPIQVSLECNFVILESYCKSSREFHTVGKVKRGRFLRDSKLICGGGNWSITSTYM